MPTASNISRNTFPIGRVLLLACGLVLGAAGLLYYFAFDPNQFSIFPPCVFHEMTGLDCPGCGGQRALHQLLHGHVIAAIRLNAMFVLSLPLLARVGGRFLVRYCRNEAADFRWRWLWGYLWAWMVFGVLRNLPFAPFTWFAA